MLTLSPQELASFDAEPKIERLTGPLTLYRFCGRNAKGEKNSPHGRCWFDATLFWRMLDTVSDTASGTHQLNQDFRFVLREVTAISYDWNSVTSVYELALPADRSIEAAYGPVAPQPFFSKDDPLGRENLPHEILIGGDIQYIVDLKAEKELQDFVRGPLDIQAARSFV